jgi:hypothetical protein
MSSLIGLPQHPLQREMPAALKRERANLEPVLLVFHIQVDPAIVARVLGNFGLFIVSKFSPPRGSQVANQGDRLPVQGVSLCSAYAEHQFFKMPDCFTFRLPLNRRLSRAIRTPYCRATEPARSLSPAAHRCRCAPAMWGQALSRR